MIYLLNIQITPGSGLYSYKLLSPVEFVSPLHQAIESDNLDNRIAVADPLEIINEFCKLEIPLCPLAKASGKIELHTGDSLITVAFKKDTNVPKPNGNKEGSTIVENLEMQAIQSHYYGDTPSGIVTCVKDAQKRSGEGEIEWYTEFRKLLMKRVPINVSRMK